MGMTFTEKQQEVIDARNSNILVSAAAGSGKTAVLTERIVQMVCDAEHPVDIDRLLVVTFTNAAAAEMRERVGLKLSERLASNPQSEHLQRQMTLLHNAQITTIDSFCLYLLRNHFNEIGLDPAFRIPDEREIQLMRQEALSELLEDAFTEKKAVFFNTVEALCHKGDEKELEKHIVSLSGYAASFPWPEEWLLERKRDYITDSIETMKEKPFWNYMLHYLRGMLQGCVDKYENAIEVAKAPDGPYMYLSLLEDEKEQFMAAAQKQEYKDLENAIAGLSFGKLSPKKDDAVSKDKRAQIKDMRDTIKDTVADIKEAFFFWMGETILKRNAGCAEIAGELIDLTLDFNRRMQEKKQEKKLVDFSDMEHFALNILLKKEEGKVVPSPVALQYREYFHEILIDEYQDSNFVQEYLLKAISGEEDGHYNRFMVGDVKQSIYRFRLARPELFMEKYETYKSEGEFRRIDLSKNFRSRGNVIESVNQVFERIMSKEIGGIQYDDAAALHAGADYPDCDGLETEFLIAEKPGKGDDLKKIQAEATVVAKRIKELMKNGQVTDKESHALRRARYQDMVILLRTLSNWGDVFKETLEQEGIPAYVTTKKGYFTATEIQNLLSFLRVIDNPYQDIPLYGALHSVFGGFTEEEIAELWGDPKEKKQSLYERLLDPENGKKDRVALFLKNLEQYRRMTSYLPIRQLLEKITGDYDYLNYVSALPGGTKRRANVEMLLVKASDFEKTSYYGLFHFIRYIEQLEKYEEDYGEADTLDENAEVVRIMSIHKSKGLEFPVVFVSGLGKNFNLSDAKSAVILDMDLGFGMDYIDGKKRIKSKTIQKNAIAKKMREDTLAEELRLLYVALTRAKEKLILTAEADAPEENYGEAGKLVGFQNRLSYMDFMKAASYMDFLSPILGNLQLERKVFLRSDMETENAMEQLDYALLKGGLQEGAAKVESQALEELKQRFQFTYPYEDLKDLFTKTTVSELKIAAMEEKDEGAYTLFEEKGFEEYIPEFRKEKEEVKGSVRGDAYHRVMEILDFEKIFSDLFPECPASYDLYARLMEESAIKSRLLENLIESLQVQLKEGRLSEEYYNIIRPDRIVAFLKSQIGYRMWRAYLNGKLHREQPFVLAIPASRLKETFPEQEKVLIQGIIDAYFEEDGEIVLLDYKTDMIGSMDALWNRYRTQLDYYQEALERLTLLPVKEKLLYSFHLGGC